MSETFTDKDLRGQVEASLDEVTDYDVQGIVDEVQSAYGTVPVDQVPQFIYFGIVERHAHAVAALTDRGRAEA